VVLDALKQASEDPEVKNLVVDLACNTGGDFDVLMAMSVLMGGPNYYYSENLVTGQRQIAYFDVDTNFDGVFDEKDKDVKYDLNIAVLTSDVSFSCGNFFPSMMQDVGFPIIGERSGGGSCAVHPFITPEGMQFQISSARDRIANKNWENIDGGVEPNYVIDVSSGDYSAFYDVNFINEIFKSRSLNPSGILSVINRGGTNVYYDLFGRKLANPAAKGIYIVNGKKVVK
jgi:C-terminal processing protease CtpA/Prc